jgi:hypothetical protein
MFRADVLALLGACVSLVACQAADGVPRRFELVPPERVDYREGGLSDLVSDPSDPSGRTFYAVTDRGPNVASGDRVVLRDTAYHQKLVRLRLDDSGARWLGVDSFSLAGGEWTTGRPPQAGKGIEGAWVREVSGGERLLAPHRSGFDFEGLATDGRGGFWLGDEYGPRLVHAAASDSGWRLDTVLEPGHGLPAVLTQRAENKGIEALARLPSGALVAMLQRPLRNAPPELADEVAKRSRVVRMVVVDPSGRVRPREFLYVVEEGGGSGKGRIGACTALDEHRLVVLENRKAKKGRPGKVDLWLVDLRGATDVGDSSTQGRRVEGQTMEMLGREPSALAKAGIRPVTKTLLAGDIAGGFPEVGLKAEGLALGAGGAYAVVVFDNDFGIDQGTAGSTILVAPIRLPSP